MVYGARLLDHLSVNRTLKSHQQFLTVQCIEVFEIRVDVDSV